MLTFRLIAMFVPAYLLLFAGFMATGAGLIGYGLKPLAMGILCLAAAAWILWLIKKKTPRGWRAGNHARSRLLGGPTT
jgi:hypothetical protein